MLVVVLMAAALTGGCSGGGGSEPAAAEPCELLSAQQIKRFVNVAPEDDSVNLERPGGALTNLADVPGMRLCRFSHESRATTVDIGIASSLPPDEFERWNEEGGTQKKLKPLKGLGREAWTLGDAIIVPVSGDKVVGVSVLMPGDEANQKERGRLLMEALLDRI